jgi:hypothetical protein
MAIHPDSGASLGGAGIGCRFRAHRDRLLDSLAGGEAISIGGMSLYRTAGYGAFHSDLVPMRK